MVEIPSTLIVEDGSLDREIIEGVLRKTAWVKKILTAENGEEALNFFVKQFEAIKRKETPETPLFILLDVYMPRMNGVEFLEELVRLQEKEDFEIPPVFIHTSSTHDVDLIKSKAFPFVKGYIMKPLTKERAFKIYKKLDMDSSRPRRA